jgi:hypothetical protein
MDRMISTFIDDEMDLDEKIAYMQAVQKDTDLVDATLELLRQEKLLRTQVVDSVPALEISPTVGWKRVMRPFFYPVGFVASGFAIAVLLLLFLVPRQPSNTMMNRFVIYRPDVSHIEIAGTFTDWRRIPMHKIGSSGYWEVRLALAKGEHRFTYILEGRQSFADPTIPAREYDDFGGENSVIHVEQRA